MLMPFFSARDMKVARDDAFDNMGCEEMVSEPEQEDNAWILWGKIICLGP